MRSCLILMGAVLIGFASLPARLASAYEPVNPDLSPAAREVFAYLQSVYGKKSLVGQNKFGEAEKAFQASGKRPAIISVDLCGWHKERWSDVYRRTLQRAIDQSKAWYLEQGGIVSVEWHWANPLTEAGTFESTRPKFALIDVGQAVTPGTETHQAVMEDMRRHADYLEQLRDAGVPVLWRPLHEIEGGWFWWSDTQTPENTAKLWRMMFEYLVGERKLDNLIWVYSSALKAGNYGKDVEVIEYRKRFYPGDRYVDIAGIDIYINAWFGWPHYQESAYPKAWEIMRQIAPNKMHALCECQGIPNPDLMAKDGPVWLYSLPWYVGGENWNPPEWVKKVYHHELTVTLDELPAWKHRPQANRPRP
jgi:mannan endo-1,4-beta-mannosidase